MRVTLLPEVLDWIIDVTCKDRSYGARPLAPGHPAVHRGPAVRGTHSRAAAGRGHRGVPGRGHPALPAGRDGRARPRAGLRRPKACRLDLIVTRPRPRYGRMAGGDPERTGASAAPGAAGDGKRTRCGFGQVSRWGWWEPGSRPRRLRLRRRARRLRRRRLLRRPRGADGRAAVCRDQGAPDAGGRHAAVAGVACVGGPAAAQAAPAPILPPAGSPPLLRTIRVAVSDQGNESVIEPQTYLYYIQTPPSRPSDGVWVPCDEAAEKSVLDDFKRLWATNFLDNLWIEVRDAPYANGVMGKEV